MLSYRSQSVERRWGFGTVLAMLDVVGTQPGQWARNLFIQGLVEDDVVRDLERRVQHGDDDQILAWFERQVITYSQVASGGAAMTRGTVDEYEQLSDHNFSAIAEWLIPRFWSDSTNSERARGVVARLKEAYYTSAVPLSWFGYKPESFHHWVPSSISPASLRSAAAVAYWAHFLDTRDAMSPEQILRHLSVLARWSPAQAFMHVSDNLKKHSPQFNGAQRHYCLSNLMQSIELWLCFRRSPDAVPVHDHVSRRMAGDLHSFMHELTLMDGSDDREIHVYSESEMGGWMNSMALQAAERFRQDYLAKYRKRRNCFSSAYFSDLVSWQVPSEEEVVHFPVGQDLGFELDGPGRYALRQTVWLEEQLARRVTELLIERETAVDEHLNEIPPTRDDVIRRFLGQQKSFRFRASEETFRQLYEQALEETVNRVAAEEGHEYAWRVACAAITMMYHVFGVVDAPVAGRPFPDAAAQPPETMRSWETFGRSWGAPPSGQTPTLLDRLEALIEQQIRFWRGP
ncbi:hypothetical protein GNI_160510 [Gregarina niphandrodes]|uniref:Uncharacterized protein n=1 Tax=Gregarina niphandrodes TaxID=110365 RepID=A0A023AYK2_GRENI|nr:hypothetical protein GNI_160510 [Gregarina niphandrodes]EZG43747.1 hypothetical protein GNI_160510 [Gregarina niphandrodes]|eukprot:XP_011134640.1 hypothetical protein GNI_160510 [Gregarina niphandrodes]